MKRFGRRTVNKYQRSAKGKGQKSKLVQNRYNDGPGDNAYDIVRGENESPILVLEFLTGRMPSRSHFNQSRDDLNPLLDTTISGKREPRRLQNQMQSTD